MITPDTPAVVYLALGSNIAPEQNLKKAIRILRLHNDALAVSPVYRTPPQGDTQQPDFLNMAVRLTTTLSPEQFKAQIISDIERRLGRVRDPRNKNASRTIDIDIALWNQDVLDYGDKPHHIPDPDITRFSHVAVPLADLAPDYVHPETGQSLAQIAAQFDQTGLHPESIDLDSEYHYIVNVEGAIWHEGRYLAIIRGAEEDHAAGLLAFVGGKVEGAPLLLQDALENTLRREIREEVGIEVDHIAYVTSSMFTGSDGEMVINIVMLCQYQSGAVAIADPGEVAAAIWLTPAEIRAHASTPRWIQNYLNSIEQVRQRIGW